MKKLHSLGATSRIIKTKLCTSVAGVWRVRDRVKKGKELMADLSWLLSGQM